MIKQKSTQLVLFFLFFLPLYSSIASEIIKLQHIELNSSLKAVLTRYMQTIPQTKIIFNEQKNFIMVYGSKEKTAEIKHLIHQLDKKRRSITIEIKTALVAPSYNFSYAFNWFGIYNKSNKKKNFAFQGIGGILDDFPTPTKQVARTGGLYVDPYNFNITMPTALFPNPAITGTGLALPITFGGLNLNKKRLSNLIEALSSIDKLTVKNHATIIACDCQTVTAESLSSVPIYTTTVKTLDNGYKRQRYGVSYKSEGITLKIKPRIIDANSIHITIYFERSKILSNDFSRITLNQTPGQLLLLPPFYDIYRLKEKIILNKNESLIISSSIKKDNETFLIKVPFLGSLPLLKKALSSKTNINALVEELIIITPTIIE